MTAVVPQHLEAQETDEELIIRPGEDPPFLIPWCASCGDTVESFTLDVITSVFKMGVQARCHGATEGTWVANEDILRRKAHGAPVIMFKKRTGFNGVR